MRFTYIKKTFDEDMLIDIFKSLVGHNCEIIINDDSIVFFHNYDNVNDINDLILSLGAELTMDVLGYTSMINKKDKLMIELDIILSLLKNVKSGMYDLKKLLLSSNIIVNKKKILDYILDGTGIDERFILDFVNSDLNVSRASKIMYLHRNTLIYKLDKFYDITGIDLKVFKDAFIMYNLLDNK